MARTIQDPQLQLGELDIAAIKFTRKSRDDIPQILQGLQYLYLNEELRGKLFSVLEKLLPSKLSWTEGRPGMPLWNIFVMSTLRVNLNWDYDRLHEMIHKHADIRAMMGNSSFIEEDQYSLQSLKDNLRLFTPELLEEINQLVVEAGHGLVKKKRSCNYLTRTV